MKVSIDYEQCINCGRCAEICPANVFEMQEKPLIVKEDACTLCGVCADQCPKQAIKIEMRGDAARFRASSSSKSEYAGMAESLKDNLELRKSPVAIKLLKTDEELPDDVSPLDFPVRHCVSINMAAHGAVFYLPMDKHACAAAKAALGMANLPEKVRNGTVPYMHGLAATQEAAARIMAEIPKLPAGTVKGTMMAPLEKATFEPDVIVLTVIPKQAMWIANAFLFDSGSPRITANFAGMQASCADATGIPYATKNVNFSVGCYGCRSAGKLADDEMYVGIPYRQLKMVVENLRGLGKAMKNL